MNTSRVAAAAAAVAIGFGVTLAGVAVGDDGDVSDVAIDDQVDAEEQEPAVVEDLDEAEVEDPSDSGSDSEDETGSESAEEVDESVGEVGEGGQVGDNGQDPPTTQVLEERPSTTVELPGTPVDTVEQPGDELDDVRCVPTISVVLTTGEQLDLVVESSEGATAWRVLDADGSFVISLEDQDVAEVVEVLRNVRFFQGAPVNFFDVCDEAGPVDGEAAPTGDSASDGRGDGEDGSARERLVFPCSDRARVQLRQPLLGDEIATLDDIGEAQLVLALRLDELGGRDFDTWWVELEAELVGFRSFSDGCPDVVENGFTPSGIFCAVARISSDDSLFTYLDTVVPTAMSDCSYEPDENGEF